MDLNKLHEFEFTKNVTLSKQFNKVLEEFNEVKKEYGNILIRPQNEITEEMREKLENESLDLALAVINLYKVSSKYGKRRASFMNWYEKLKGYAKGKYKEFLN